MKLHANKLAGASTAAMSILYFFSSVFFLLMPEKALQLTASFMHLTSLEEFLPDVEVNFFNVTSGMLQVALCTFLVVWLSAHFYNFLLDMPETGKKKTK